MSNPSMEKVGGSAVVSTMAAFSFISSSAISSVAGVGNGAGGSFTQIHPSHVKNDSQNKGSEDPSVLDKKMRAPICER